MSIGPKPSASQKAQTSQAGGPTIGGVAGVSKQKSATRPKSAQRPSIVHAHHTGPSASGLGEGRESEHRANNQLKNSVKAKIKAKTTPQKSGGDDYFSHNEKKTMKEDAAMSVGGGAVPTITNPTANYALQKKMREKTARRKKPA